ncbi:MAG: response regulator [Gammaproteobacteria bacterium]|nr:response regulator [Gammaproteobacteria bacterium]
MSNNNTSILIVEDTQTILALVTNILKENNFTNLATAANGEEALTILENKTFDLILLDIVMPGIDGFEVCRRIRENKKLIDVPIIFLTSEDNQDSINKGLKLGAQDYVTKPFNPEELITRVKTQIKMYQSRRELTEINNSLEKQAQENNLELESVKDKLQNAIKNLHKIKITNGVYWLQIPEVDLFILCGCPADVVKLLKKKDLISIANKENVSFETGPNCILLSDTSVQNGFFSNLAEFPVLQMFYLQGMLIPNHPNNTGKKPLIIGSEEQVNAQMKYIYRGNYGLDSLEEIMDAGIERTLAEDMMKIKHEFSFGEFKPIEKLLDHRIIDKDRIEIRDGVYATRLALNIFKFEFKNKSVIVDLNLQNYESYESPYTLEFHSISREYFSIVHCGEGDGWDPNRPSMGSIIVYLGKVYLIDTGPGIINTLRALSIDISEIQGIFQTHAHDDHFAGLPTLIQSDHRIKYYATTLVRKSVTKKLSALLSIDEQKFEQYFEVFDLEFDQWNDIEGLEVKPLFSPHPVETNIFIFRSLAETGYKTYAHYADIIDLEKLKNMAEKKDLSHIYEQVKNNYLEPVTIKKLDIGGGMIHGNANDFKDDQSENIILAHTSHELNGAQKEIGSSRSFGAEDVLIPSNQKYLSKQASRLLQVHFPEVPFSQLRILLNAPIVSFNPGSIINKLNSDQNNIYFILTGTVEFIDSELLLKHNLSNGCFIGNLSLFDKSSLSGTWRAITYVQALRLTSYIYTEFLEKFGLLKGLQATVEKIAFMQKTYLFGEGLSYIVQNRIAKIMMQKSFKKDETVHFKEPSLIIVKTGMLQILNNKNKVIDELSTGDFCGESSFLDSVEKSSIKCASDVEVYYVPKCDYMAVPIVHWKLLEKFKKRKQLFL